MKISEVLSMSKINDSVMEEVLSCHPKQIISDSIDIPVWQIKYKYLTQRNNGKEAIKYIFLDESAWDSVDHRFNLYIKDFNEKYPDRQLSNVEILDVEYLGELLIEIE
jgi:hypothetical protein